MLVLYGTEIRLWKIPLFECLFKVDEGEINHIIHLEISLCILHL